MQNIYSAVTEVFYQLSLIFFWPVAIALLVLLAVSVMDLGALLYEVWRRRREPRTNLSEAASRVSSALRAMPDGAAAMEVEHLSPSLQRFWNRLRRRLVEVGSREHLDIWLEESLQQEEIAMTSRLDRTRALIRIGPMLGLAGTIIPLGPALKSLLAGNMAAMVNHLVIGFGAVVCGLMLSGIAYLVTLVRERWTRVEPNDMEN